MAAIEAVVQGSNSCEVKVGNSEITRALNREFCNLYHVSHQLQNLRNHMTRITSRREFLRDLGICAAALPFVLNLPSLGFANQQAAQAAAGGHVQPQRRRAQELLAGRRRRRSSRSRKASRRSSRSRTRCSSLHGVCDKVRGDGDNHMRGIGCLLTGIELFPGNIQGGSRHAGRLGQRHLDRSGDQELPASNDATRARGSARSNSA